MTPLKVIIAGGGTGGHIFPAVAIGHALQRIAPGTELLFVGANGKMEMEKVPQEGFRIIGLDIAGLNRSNMLKNILLPLKLIRSALKARGIIKAFRPDAVIGVGGYASFPVLNAAQAQGIPTVIQEQNSFAGKSNKLLGRKAKLVCVAYDNMDTFFPVDRIRLTGNPVRHVIAQSNFSKANAGFFATANRKTLLVVGGSLGAKSINEAIDQHLDELITQGIQVIWQTGKPYFEQAKRKAAGKEDMVQVFDFIREMDKAYAAADIVISRAGALAIAELCIVAKPVIFVPYPYAAEDHQTSNAMALVKKNAAILVRDDEAATRLLPELNKLLKDEQRQDSMSSNLKQLAIKDADERIAHYVIELAKQIN
jgi:UDP-N-acetylglucosamine--N-acetylmuramyl-(pentapeptide) pyrophosphoryl-undecaprenol N-acetylglucosamine transferase